MILAIGLVVDDAIVVVEAVEKHIEEGLSLWTPQKGHGRSFERGHRYRDWFGLGICSGSISRGITGQLYKQFALTLACSSCSPHWLP